MQTYYAFCILEIVLISNATSFWTEEETSNTFSCTCQQRFSIYLPLWNALFCLWFFWWPFNACFCFNLSINFVFSAVAVFLKTQGLRHRHQNKISSRTKHWTFHLLKPVGLIGRSPRLFVSMRRCDEKGSYNLMGNIICKGQQQRGMMAVR